jgi:alpha-L-arabinofuranosidase
MNRSIALSLLGILIIAANAGNLPGQEIRIDASKVQHRVTTHLTGACIEDVNHEIYGGIYSQMLFGESFQEPAPSPPIAGFKTYGGNWRLGSEGVLTVRATDGPKLVSEHKPFRDGSVGVEVKFDSRDGVNGGLVVRTSDPGVRADRFIGYEVALNAAEQKLLLGRHRNNFEAIQNVPCEVALGRWIPLEVKMAGSVIEVLVDGKRVLRHDDGEHALPAGSAALRAWHREAGFRNMWVKTDEDREPLPFKAAGKATEISGMWRAVHKGSAHGEGNLVSSEPFAGTQSQRITFKSGAGEWGIENRGLNRSGLNFVADRPYEGLLWARADEPTSIIVAAESHDGAKRYAETELKVTNRSWQRFRFTLTPNAADEGGRFAIVLNQPGSVDLGHVFLQPEDWGRFKRLPVRRDVAEGLIRQGITVLRYGGSMINNDEYRWKKMIGPRDRRPPYRGLWYPYSTNGWGILDFMDFCEAAKFEYVPAFNMGESPEDMADFIEYAKGSTASEWGRKRTADGHPQPYRLPYLELGNEERVDENYAAKFEALATALWAKDPQLILVVGDFVYDHPIRDPMKFTGAASQITNMAGHATILELARKHDREVWFDVHIDTNGPGRSGSLNALPTYIDALAKIAKGAKHKVVVFEYNSGNHAIRRALGNALATNIIERDGRLPIVTSANCLQPDKQNDNGWDQGLLFLNPAHVWLQPPGYVTQMQAQNYQPEVVQCEVFRADNQLDATSKRSEDGSTLVLQVVNITDHPIETKLHITGFAPAAEAQVTQLSGPLDAVNTAEHRDAVVPKQSTWKHELKDGEGTYTFPAHSFTVIRWTKGR